MIRALSGNYTIQNCTFKTNNNYRLIYNTVGWVSVQNSTFQTENADGWYTLYNEGMGTLSSKNNRFNCSTYAIRSNAGSFQSSNDTVFRGYAAIMGTSLGMIDKLNASQLQDNGDRRVIWISTTGRVDIKNSQFVPFNQNNWYYVIRVNDCIGTINLQNVVVNEVVDEASKEKKRALEINEFTGTINADSQCELPYIWTGGGSNRPAGHVNLNAIKNAYRFWCEASNLDITMESPKSVGWMYNNSTMTINNASIPKHIENRRNLTITNSSMVQDVNNAFHGSSNSSYRYTEALNNFGTATLINTDLTYMQSPWNTELVGIRNQENATLYLDSTDDKLMTILGLYDGIYNANGRVILGTKDGVYQETIAVKGSLRRGIASTVTGTTLFYDGVVTGPTDSITGTISDLEIGFGLDMAIDEAGLHYAKLTIWEDIALVVETGQIYNSLREAVESITTSEPRTIQILKDYRHVMDWTISENQNIILDLNGKQLVVSRSIVNHGNLEVIDSSDRKVGVMNMLATITNYNVITFSSGTVMNERSGTNENRNNMIYNSHGIININGGTIKTVDTGIKYTTVVLNDGGTVNMTSGNVYDGYSGGVSLRAFENWNGGVINISGGYVRGYGTGEPWYGAQWHQLVYNNGYSYINITGGEFYLGGGGGTAAFYLDGLYEERTPETRATLRISNAKITYEGTTSYKEQSAIYLNKYDNLILENVTIKSNSYAIRDGNNNQTKDKWITNCDIEGAKETIIQRRGTIHISGGEIAARGEAAALAMFDSGVAEIDNGSFYCYNNGTGIYLEGGPTVNFHSGIVYKVALGINIASGIVNFGTNDEGVTLDTPIVQANTTGVNVQGAGTFNFYDGMVKGISTSIAGSVNQKAPQYTVFSDTETIDEVVYQRKYLAKIYVVENVDTGVQYTSLVDAINDIEYYGYLKFIFTAAESDTINILKNQTIVIDLNGQNVTTTATIINRGTLTFKDTSEDQLGNYANGKSGTNDSRNNAIYNYGTLYIESGTVKTSDTGVNYTTVIVNNGGTVNMTGGNVYDGYSGGISQRAFENWNGGVINISGGYVRGYGTGEPWYGAQWHQLVYNNGYSYINITGGEFYLGGGGGTAAFYLDGLYEEREPETRATLRISNAKITYAGTTSYKEQSAIYLNKYDNLILENVTIKSNSYAIRDGNNNQTKDKWITNCDIEGAKETIIQRRGTIHISGGEIAARGEAAALAMFDSGVAEIEDDVSFYCYNNGTGIYLEGGPTVNFHSGYVHLVNLGININNGIFNFETGLVEANTTGINISSGTVNFGINDEDITAETPLVVAGTTGVTKTGSGAFNFYDGMVKGRSVAMNENIDLKPDGYEIINDRQGDYARRYLGQFEVIENVATGVKYNTIAEAFAECIDGENELRILNDTNLTSQLTIEVTKKITLDLAGKTVNSSRQIINYGTFTVKDSSTNQTGVYSNGKSGTNENRNNAIYNYGTLNIESGTVKTADTGINYTTVVYNNGGIVNMTGGNVYDGYSGGVSQRAFENWNGGTLNISGGYVRGYGTGEPWYGAQWHQLIYNRGFSNINITGGEFYLGGGGGTAAFYLEGDYEAISQARAQVSISNAKITYAGTTSYKEQSAIYLGKYDNLTLNNVTINSNAYAIRDGNSNQSKDKVITNCEIIASNKEALILRQGKTEITNTTIYSCICFAQYNGSQTELTNVRLLNTSNSGTGLAVYESSTLTINSAEMTNGIANITGATGMRIDSSSIVQINSITLEKFATGIWILNNGTLRYGIQGGDISITDPSITTNSCGVNNESGYFYFYDGVVKSKGNAILGFVTGTETNYIVDSADDEEGYHNATLISNVYGDGTIFYASVTQSGTTQHYASVQEALDACTAGGEIVGLLRSTDLGNNVLTIRSGQSVTINLHGWTIRSAASLNPAITNYGQLQIKGDTMQGTVGKIESTEGPAILNYGILNIGVDDGTVASGTTQAPGIIGNQYGIDNQGTLNFYDGYIKGATAINGNDIQLCPLGYMIVKSDSSPEVVTLQETAMVINYTVEEATIHLLVTNAATMYILVGPPYQTVNAVNGVIDYDYTVPANGDYMFMICDVYDNYTTINISVNTVPEIQPPTNEVDNETNTIGNDTNTVGNETNTIGDDTNTIGDDTNTVGDDTNTIGDDTNTIGDDTNTTGEP